MSNALVYYSNAKLITTGYIGSQRKNENGGSREVGQIKSVTKSRKNINKLITVQTL